MTDRELVKSLSYEDAQLVRESVCEGCKGDIFWPDSDCQYDCPAFIEGAKELLSEDDA